MKKYCRKGWKSLTSKESGRIGGMITGRKTAIKRGSIERKLKIQYTDDTRTKDDPRACLQRILNLDRQKHEKPFFGKMRGL